LTPWEFALSPWTLGALGLLVGSFLNVVIHRLPLMQERRWWSDVVGQLGDQESHQRTFSVPPKAATTQVALELQQQLASLPLLSLAKPASRCPHCGHQIRWFENVPLISWLVLKGRCSACKGAISLRYPVIELLTGLLFAAMAWRFGHTPSALLWCGVVAVLVALSAIDWDTTLLPDDLTLPLLWAGLLAATAGWTLPLDQAVIGAALGYGVLWSIYWLFKLTTGKEGMGYGDFKLLAALGAWLGWQAILPILLASSVVGTVVGLTMKATGGLREGRYVPFGPFLAGGGLLVMIVGLPTVLGWIGWV
jgi:leader peptidase (prepilin peptidase) / N-methyltransferase